MSSLFLYFWDCRQSCITLGALKAIVCNLEYQSPKVNKILPQCAPRIFAYQETTVISIEALQPRVTAYDSSVLYKALLQPTFSKARKLVVSQKNYLA